MSDFEAHKPESEKPWGSCTFEGAELATLRQGAKLTFAEKIAWLEDMQELSMIFQRSRQRRGLRTMFSDGHIE